MSELLANLTLEKVWAFIKQPRAIIIYLAVIIALMLLTVISVMVNESRFSKFGKRLGESVNKAEKRAQEKSEKEERASRFEMLKAIDGQNKNYIAKDFVEDITLKEFCERFRLFAASRLGLYYDISTIREFVAGMAVSHLLILQGMSGTGKTSLAFAIGEFLENPSTVIPVQPMWKERSDLLGYYNEFTKRFNETLFLQKLYEADCREDIYVTILDEMNIARMEYYFADFLSLMEIPDPKSRYLEVTSSTWESDPEKLVNGRIKLPENMWFIGTANNDDSTFAISDKVYDRAMIIDFESKSEAFTAEDGETAPITAKKFVSLVDEAAQNITPSAENMEKLRLVDNYLIEKFQISFGNRIMKQIETYLPVYVGCGGEEIDALDDILAKKILRKLESQNMAYRKSEADNLCNYLNELFGEGKMARSLEYVRRISKSN